jgi:hypothetical protein
LPSDDTSSIAHPSQLPTISPTYSSHHICHTPTASPIPRFPPHTRIEGHLWHDNPCSPASRLLSFSVFQYFWHFWHFAMPSIPSRHPLAAVNAHALIDPGTLGQGALAANHSSVWTGPGGALAIATRPRRPIAIAFNGPRATGHWRRLPRSEIWGLHAGEVPLWKGTRDEEMDSFRAGARPPTAMAHGPRPMGPAPRDSVPRGWANSLPGDRRQLTPSIRE